MADKLEGEMGQEDQTGYFENLKKRLDSLADADRSEAYFHLKYLSEKAGVAVDDLLNGVPFNVDEEVEQDARRNINEVISKALAPLDNPQPIEATAEQREFFRELTYKTENILPRKQRLINKHLNYLGQHSHVSVDEINSGKPFSCIPSLLTDAIHNITNVLNEPELKPNTNSHSISKFEEFIGQAELTLQGWCTREKAKFIHDCILEREATTCVEIGVYGGRSLVPAAFALKSLGRGSIYGIETWRPEIAVEHVTNELNDEWWTKIDFHQIKTDFFIFIADNGLASHIRIIEAPAADVAALFSSIDFLHVDGAHSMYNAAEDVVMYGKRVRKGGVILLDDTEWPSVAPAIAILESFCTLISCAKNDDGHITWMAFEKN